MGLTPEQQFHKSAGLYLSDFHWGSEFRLAMTDRATIAGMEVAKLVPWNSLLYWITSVSIEAQAAYSCT